MSRTAVQHGRRRRDRTGGADKAMSRRRFLGLAAAAAGATVAGASLTEAYRFGVVRHAVFVPGLRAPMRLTFLTDLHFGPYVGTGSVARWVDAALGTAPDLIVLGGDLVDAMPFGRPEALLAQLARLSAPLGVYSVWGNHDHARFRARPHDEVEARLRGVGIEPLRNAGVDVRPDLHLAGINDYRQGDPDLAATLARRPPGVATVLVSHNPDVLPEVPADVALTLCGHTHGGQVRLPLVGAVVTSSAYGQRFAQGWVEAPARGYVSRGLGVSLLPIRIACPAELSVFDLGAAA